MATAETVLALIHKCDLHLLGRSSRVYSPTPTGPCAGFIHDAARTPIRRIEGLHPSCRRPPLHTHPRPPISGDRNHHMREGLVSTSSLREVDSTPSRGVSGRPYVSWIKPASLMWSRPCHQGPDSRHSAFPRRSDDRLHCTASDHVPSTACCSATDRPSERRQQPDMRIRIAFDTATRRI